MSSNVSDIAYNRVMSERDEKRGGAGCAIAGAALLLLLMLYVLGIGPAALIAKNYPATDVWLQMLYFPLLTIGWACKPFGGLIEWYVELWGG